MGLVKHLGRQIGEETSESCYSLNGMDFFACAGSLIIFFFFKKTFLKVFTLKNNVHELKILRSYA